MVAQMAPSEAARLFRRSLVVAVALGGAALVVLSVLGHPLAGVFAVVGLGLGAFNGRQVLLSIARFAAAENPAARGPLIASMLKRLALITLVALAIVVAYRPDGIAVLGGLALFQMLVIGRASGVLLREVRRAG